MKTRVIVHGKSQSRTALGIINAYLKLHPDSTPADVQQAFPKSLNRRCTADNLIIPVEETLGHEKMFFERDDELIVFNNGKKYALVEIWDKDDYKSICEHAKQYGIEVAEEGIKPFEKGSFKLEYLDEGCFKWWWMLLLILLLLLLLILFFRKCNRSTSDECTAENVTLTQCCVDSRGNECASTNPLITDSGASILITLPDGNVLNIAKSSREFELFSFLNSDAQVEADQTKGWIILDKVHFETGKTDISNVSESQLRNVAMLMRFFPNAHLKIGGYTDCTGNDEINMRISSERAKVTAEKIVALGGVANRITHEGYGTQRPVCPANDTDDCRAANRRVEIRVTKK